MHDIDQPHLLFYDGKFHTQGCLFPQTFAGSIFTVIVSVSPLSEYQDIEPRKIPLVANNEILPSVTLDDLGHGHGIYEYTTTQPLYARFTRYTRRELTADSLRAPSIT